MKELLAKWAQLAEGARVVIVTDAAQMPLALKIREGVESCEIAAFEPDAIGRLGALEERDLVIAALSLETYIGGGGRVFSPFAKPDGVKAKYAFIRLGISAESLIFGLETPKELVYAKMRELAAYKPGSMLRVTNAAGTDISLCVKGFESCSHEITSDGGMAFWPPSESSSEVEPGGADGTICVDVTVGQLYYFGKLLDGFGLVRGSVALKVRNGLVVDVDGGEVGKRLKEKLFALPAKCRELVELGHGLSDMAPTGLIGVDESIISTCHFGIGDGQCGVHLDVVVSKPKIELISKVNGRDE